MKTIKIYQSPNTYTAWIRNGNEQRTFIMRYSPKQYTPDKVRAMLQLENPKALVQLYI